MPTHTTTTPGERNPCPFWSEGAKERQKDGRKAISTYRRSSSFPRLSLSRARLQIGFPIALCQPFERGRGRRTPVPWGGGGGVLLASAGGRGGGGAKSRSTLARSLRLHSIPAAGNQSCSFCEGRIQEPAQSQDRSPLPACRPARSTWRRMACDGSPTIY